MVFGQNWGLYLNIFKSFNMCIKLGLKCMFGQTQSKTNKGVLFLQTFKTEFFGGLSKRGLGSFSTFSKPPSCASMSA